MVKTPPDPHYLLLDLFQGEDRIMERVREDRPVRHPTILEINASGDAVIPAIIAGIRDHVQRYGPLRELVFSGHGRGSRDGEPPKMSSSFVDEVIRKIEGHSTNQFALPDMLDALTALQQELGTRIADRVVFGGCSLMQDPHDPLVLRFQQFAIANHSSLVLPTTSVFGHKKGRYVEITPEGDFTRDKLDPSRRVFAHQEKDAWDEAVFNRYETLKADRIPEFTVEARSVQREVSPAPTGREPR